MLRADRFPRIWVPRLEQRDTRQRLLHPHKLVQMRRQVKNELQPLAPNPGVQQKRKLGSESGRQRLQVLPLTGWIPQGCADSLELLDNRSGRIAKLDQAARQEAWGDRVARWLRTHPGVGPTTGWRFR